jgi:hypothetical protein
MTAKKKKYEMIIFFIADRILVWFGAVLSEPWALHMI